MGPIDGECRSEVRFASIEHSRELRVDGEVWRDRECRHVDVGEYVHWNRVTYQLKEINRFHKVIFHTIAYSDNKWYRDQLEKIAEATGGDFAWFE